MKKLMLLFLLITIPVFAVVHNIGDIHYFIYHIIDSDGNHVAGQTVTLEIYRKSDGYKFDFNDSTFKVSGWTSGSVNLSEDADIGYFYDWTPPGTETTENQYQFVVDNSDATYGDHQSELAIYIDFSNFTTAERSEILQRLRRIPR